MKITTARRISQIFFLGLFLWFCIVMTLGAEWRQLRGWPVNWFLQLDPLTGITTVLTTRSLYAGLLWGLVTIVLTLVLGRIFCGWVCPFGTIHQIAGFLGHYKSSVKEKIRLNDFHRGQSVKYWILIFFLTAAVLNPSLQTGLLDPIPLLYRSVNLILMPLADNISVRYYDEAWSIGIIFFIAVMMNLRIPRFYCRFVCPLGALLGLLSRFAVWRVIRKDTEVLSCSHCRLCEKDCQGACQPSEQLRISECLVCMNCLRPCPHDLIGYGAETSASGEILSPDVSRRAFMISCLSGAAAVPMLRLSGNIDGPNWNAQLIRPPGALSEKEFLARCVKCGQCMRICPSNVIHPAGLSAGSIEALWTPVLNFRIGTSGCQFNCIACGYLCPTAAIRPLSLDERKGIKQYAVKGPIKTGTAFLDQGRCLPWAMDKPCIVCQENCPVSPKAIGIKEYFSTVVKSADLPVKQADALHIGLDGNRIPRDRFSTGDYYCVAEGDRQPRRITENSENSLTTDSAFPWEPVPKPGAKLEIQIRLQRPFIDPNRCIGCGVCEHECPVKGRAAIRVFAENESRNRKHALML